MSKGENKFSHIQPKAIDSDSSLAKLNSGDPRKSMHAKNVYPLASAAKINGTATNSNKVGSYGWVEYYQCDPAWAWQQLGWCEGCSICYYVCAMT
jgi:hypothetical protein